MAKSSKMICAVWRMEKQERPMTYLAIASTHFWITVSLPGET